MYFLIRKKMLSRVSVCAVLIIAASTLSPRLAIADEVVTCPLGQQRASWTTNEDGTRSAPLVPCEPAKWTLLESDDGFSSSLNIYASPHPDPKTSAKQEDWVSISCSKKKLSVIVLFEYPYSVGWVGQGQVLFDKGKASKFKFTVSRDFKYLSLNSPKDFLAKLVKSKTSFSLKVPLVSGSKLGTYAKGDLSTYKSKFSKAGCKF
jgi:hypothetical protein